jgi:hypothetical protein
LPYSGSSPQAERYLSLLKKSLLNELNPEVEARLVSLAYRMLANKPFDRAELLDIRSSVWMQHIQKVRSEGWSITLQQHSASGKVVERRDLRFLSENCHTMMGRKRLDHLHQCLEAVVKDDIAGDFIETGVWRGGGTIFMRGFLEAHAIEGRSVWVADSFQGLPRPTHERDAGWDLSKDTLPSLAVSLDEVKELFQRYELLDERVRFLPGWFKDTLPDAPISALSVLRLDGDLYESTQDALSALYPKLSRGGFVIIDDFKALEPCEAAVNDFRNAHAIDAPMEAIDSLATFWRKP